MGRQLYEFDEAAVLDWVDMLYRACLPRIRASGMTPERAAEYVALVGERTLVRMQRERPDMYEKVRQMLVRPVSTRV